MKKDFKNLARTASSPQSSRSFLAKIFPGKKSSSSDTATRSRPPVHKPRKKREQSSQTLIKKNTLRQETNSQQTQQPSFFVKLIQVFLGVIFAPFVMISRMFSGVFQQRAVASQVIFSVIFLSLVFQFYNLQVLNQSLGAGNSLHNLSLTFPERGQIFVQDISFNRDNRPLTSSIYTSKVTLNPATLKTMIETEVTTREDALQSVSGSLNIPLDEVATIIDRELSREKPRQYAVLHEDLDVDQTRQLKTLLLLGEHENVEFGTQNFINWLNVEDTEVRTYPEGKFLSPTIGYMREKPAPAEEVAALPGCGYMIQQNIERGTDFIQYKMPSGGLEQRFCSELAGLNGRGLSNAEIAEGSDTLQAVNGGDVYLTIDYNIQRKAEDILARMIRNNSNAQGAPKDGSIIVVEANHPTNPQLNGRVLAMANYPSFDPNIYTQEFEKDPAAFRNTTTSADYEIGSVMKPMTVAMALNEYFEATEKNQSRTPQRQCPGGDSPLDLAAQQPDKYDLRLCISPNWTFNDYEGGAKTFTELNGDTLQVANYNSNYFGSNQGLSNILRDSINTGISDIMDNHSREQVNEYFLNRFRFGQTTLADLPGDAHGNTQPFQNEIGKRISNTFFGFGQGFTASPFQVARAYMPILHEGQMIEPYVVDRIEYSNQVVDYGTTQGSKIFRPEPEEVIRPEVAQLVKSYMVNTSQQGYRGRSHPINLDGYSNGSKTGTAQIARFVDVKDENGNPIIEANGQTRKVWLGYDDHSALGLTNHSFVGFAPENNPRVLVFLKMAEPQPGNVQASSLVTLKDPYKEMLQYTLEYLGVPGDL